MKKKRFCAAIAAVLLLGLLILCVCREFPILLEGKLPEAYTQAIRSQAEGVYSQKLPLIPVFVRVTEFDRERVWYTIYYFPFGSVGMSYHPQDGYNMEKTLSRS